MRSNLRSLMIAFVGALMLSPVFAQINTPAPSPFASFEQVVGLTTISMEYSRPGVKGRTVFGELVPYGKIWRTGANQSTKITFSDDVKLAGKDVEAGTYGIYSIPGESEWTVMLYTDLSLGGHVSEYDEEKEYVRFTVESQDFPGPVESLTFMVGNISDNSASIYLIWENTMISIPVEVAVDEAVMAQIDQVMAGPSAGDYYQAAVYYYNTDRDMEQALEWIDMALEGGERYWIVTWKARILGKMGNYDDAIATAEHAKKMADEAGNADYVKINSDLIAEFKSK